MSCPFPQKFYDGVDQFNHQQFYESHDTLEAVWSERLSNDRVFIQGIIQIAVACHHLKHDNQAGAIKLFQQGLSKVKQFTPSFAGLDVGMLIDDVNQLQAELHRESTGQEKLQKASRFAFPVLKPSSCK